MHLVAVLDLLVILHGLHADVVYSLVMGLKMIKLIFLFFGFDRSQ